MLRPSEPKPAPRRPASRCRSSRDIRSGYHFFGQYGASQAADVEAEQTRSAFLVGVQTAAGANALFEQRLDPASGRVDFLLWQPDAFVSSLTEDLFTDLDAPDVNGLSLHVIWPVGRQYKT